MSAAASARAVNKNGGMHVGDCKQLLRVPASSMSDCSVQVKKLVTPGHFLTSHRDSGVVVTSEVGSNGPLAYTRWLVRDCRGNGSFLPSPSHLVFHLRRTTDHHISLLPYHAVLESSPEATPKHLALCRLVPATPSRSNTPLRPSKSPRPPCATLIHKAVVPPASRSSTLLFLHGREHGLAAVARPFGQPHPTSRHL